MAEVEALEFLEQMLHIPSVSGEEAALADFLLEQMERLGFQPRRDEVGNVIGEIGPEDGRRIVLLGHMDTVPGEIPVRLDNGRLYGRGAVDAKGPLAAFILAAAKVAPSLRHTRVLVIGVVEEEAQSRGAHYIAETHPAPAMAIVGEPSGWDGVTLGYKGTLSVEYYLERPNIHTASGRYVAPAEEAIAFWNRLMTYTQVYNKGEQWRFDTLDATLREIRSDEDGLAKQVYMRVGLRLPVGIDLDDLKVKIRGMANGADLRFPYYELPFLSERNTPPARALLRAIRAEGGRPRFKVKTGTADTNVIAPAWGCPVVAYGPGDAALDHTPDEHIEVEEYLRGIRVLERVLSDLDQAE